MLERTTTFGNKVEYTVTFEGKPLKVQPVTQRTFLEVESMIRQFWRTNYIKAAEETKDEKTKQASIRTAIMTVNSPAFVRSEEFAMIQNSELNLYFWIRVCIEGMKNATEETILKFVEECGAEFTVLLEGMTKVWKDIETEIKQELGDNPDPKAVSAKLKARGLE